MVDLEDKIACMHLAQDEEKIEENSEEKISLHGWLVVWLIFTADAISLGGRALFLVVILLFEDEFGWSRRFG